MPRLNQTHPRLCKPGSYTIRTGAPERKLNILWLIVYENLRDRIVDSVSDKESKTHVAGALKFLDEKVYYRYPLHPEYFISFLRRDYKMEGTNDLLDKLLAHLTLVFNEDSNYGA